MPTPLVEEYNDYIQSANTLFHFMKKPEFLKRILEQKNIVPRYCIEDISYLNIHTGEHSFNRVAVLQKCFCDIPFHKLNNTFNVEGVGETFESLPIEEQMKFVQNNTHPEYYGKYAIAFSKEWGERNNLQPVQYINKTSNYAVEFSQTLFSVLDADDVPDIYADDILKRLGYIKPLRGIMSRPFEHKKKMIQIDIIKNFHDEREWRYIPDSATLSEFNMNHIIANPNILMIDDSINKINESLSADKYKKLWLDFDYDDIRYIIVPDSKARIDIIEVILNISDTQFKDTKFAERERHILISKILVLDEIRKDW